MGLPTRGAQRLPVQTHGDLYGRLPERRPADGQGLGVRLMIQPLGRLRARSIAGLFPQRYLRQRGRPRCLGFRTVHVRFRSHGSSVVRLLSRAPSNRLAWEMPFRHFIHTSGKPGSCRMHAYSLPSRPHHRSHVSVAWALPQALASWEIPPHDLACG